MLKRSKWIGLLAAPFMLWVTTNMAWTIGAKGRVTGPAIHTTYFLTPNNAPTLVHAVAYAGNFQNGVCQYRGTYDLGNETLQSGDYVDIDAFLLKSVLGVSYNCLTISYYSKQLARETFVLLFDGMNYSTSNPSNEEVQIL